ncbi:MAG: hypothetical protein R6U04_09760 [Bacteroidales bacterium]
MENFFQKAGITVLLVFISLQLFSTPPDTTRQDTKEGWTFGALPVVAYDTDRGFKYGGLVNFYNYGDGSTFPDYKHSIYMEISRTTKRSGINQLLFDSQHILPNHPVRFTVDLSYFTERSLDFYGFNGYNSRYKRAFTEEKNDDYISRMFYRYERELFHFSLHMQDYISDSDFKWLLGVEHFDHKLNPFDFEQYNEGTDSEDQLEDTTTLYELYDQWGLIPEKDKDGGRVNYLKSGIIYDSRDQEANPMQGVWSEVLLAGAPSILSNKKNTYLKMSAIHRQYFTLLPKELNLAVRLGYQGTIAGKSPFYMQSYLLSSFTQSVNVEGLGGSKSLRGINRNRIIGDDIVYGNLELRWKFLRKEIFNQHIYIALSTFGDAGTVIDPIEIDKSNIPDHINQEHFFSDDKDKLHSSAGIGLHFALNYNFVVAVDYGRALDRRDGSSGLYIGMNFLY